MQAHLRSLSLSLSPHTHTHTLHLRSAQVTWKQHEARIRGEQPAARQAGDQPSPLAGVLGTGARGTPAGGLRWSPAPLRKRAEAALGAQREACNYIDVCTKDLPLWTHGSSGCGSGRGREEKSTGRRILLSSQGCRMPPPNYAAMDTSWRTRAATWSEEEDGIVIRLMGQLRARWGGGRGRVSSSCGEIVRSIPHAGNLWTAIASNLPGRECFPSLGDLLCTVMCCCGPCCCLLLYRKMPPMQVVPNVRPGRRI